jgi:hypothetical protein
MAEYFRKFDMQNPTWGEMEHLTNAIQCKQIDPDELMDLLHDDFKSRQAGGDNIAMFICGGQGQGKSIAAYYFAKLLSKTWGTTFNWGNLSFFDAETSESLDKANEGETIWQDEHDSRQIGALSVYLKDRLVDFVLRGRRKRINFIFCSPNEQDKGQFITLEAKNTRKDPKTGKPLVVECLVKTPWYFNSSIRITRGIIFVPVDDLLNDLILYDKRKVESLDKLKSQYGSNFDFIGTKAKEIFDKLKEYLIEKNKKNDWVPKKGVAFKTICLLGKGTIKGIGSSGTSEFRELMIESVKNNVIDYCEELNESSIDSEDKQKNKEDDFK